MATVLKGLQIARDIPYREPDSLFALGGADGMGKKRLFARRRQPD